MKIAIGVPVLNNFKGVAELFNSLWGNELTPFVVDNWNNNLGVASGWNKILDASEDAEATIICNDDITFKRESLNVLISSWFVNKPEDAILISAFNSDKAKAELTPGTPDYSCFIFNTKQMLEKVGKFDQNFYPAYFEDNDHHYRIRLAGYEAYQCRLSLIEHKGSQTQNADPKNPVCTSEMFEKNRDYFVRKWGGLPGAEKFTNPFNNTEMTLRDW